MANLHEIIQWCDQTLKAAEFKDYAPNGLQIEGSTEVKCIVCAVTASEEAIDAAIAQNADIITRTSWLFLERRTVPNYRNAR